MRYLLKKLRLSRVEWLFLGLLAFSYSYFMLPAGTNTLSRYDMIEALGHGTAVIDSYLLTPDGACAAFPPPASAGPCQPTAPSSNPDQACGNEHYTCNTIDVSYYHGHYYSPRSLGLSLLAVPPYLILLFLSNLFHITLDPTVALALLNIATILPFTLLAVALLMRLVRALRPDLTDTAYPLAIASAYALGTLAYPFATGFLSHQLGGALMLSAFYLLWRARASDAPTPLLLLAGLAAGFAVISEYPTGSIAILLGGYVLLAFRRRLRSLALFILPMLPVLALLLAYNQLAFGNPLALSYGFVTGKDFADQHSGFFGVTLPHPTSLITLLFSQRGLLVESPFLMLAPIGFYSWWKRAPQWRPEALLCIAVIVVYLLWNASYFLPMGGISVPGPRFLVPMLPFACLALTFCADRLRWLFTPLLASSILISFFYVASGVRITPAYGPYPFASLWFPLLLSGRVAPQNGPTPLNLGHDLLHLPQPLSLYLAFLPLLAWLGWLCYQSLWGIARMGATKSLEPSLSRLANTSPR